MLYFMEKASEYPMQRVLLKAHTFYRGRTQFRTIEGAFHVWVMIVPENGSFDYQVGEEKGAAGFGEFVVAPPEVAFARSVTSRSLNYHVLQWSWQGAENVLFPVGKWRIDDAARLASSLALLRPMLGKRDWYSLRRIENILEDLLLLAWQERHARPSIKDPTMREAARLLHSKAGESFSMSEVSAALGLGPVQFTRRFRACHGTTPIEFLTAVRLQNAQKMLIETDWTLEQIARHCGWASGFYLSNVFAQKLQTTPRAFRKLHRV